MKNIAAIFTEEQITNIQKWLVRFLVGYMAIMLVGFFSKMAFGGTVGRTEHITVSPYLETYAEQTKTETIIRLAKSKQYNICTVKSTDYAENWMTDDLCSLAKSVQKVVLLKRAVAWKKGGEIAVPQGASVVDLSPIKSYSWKESDGDQYHAEYFVFEFGGYACKLERVSKKNYETEINLYCGLVQ